MQGAGGTRHYEFGKRVVARGHEFVVVASDLSYLDAKKLNQKTEQVDGIKILRPTIPSFIHKGFLWRIIAYIIYMFSSFWRAVREPKIDLVMGTSPSLFQALSAAWVSILRRRPFLLEVRDLWPDFAIEMGVLKSKVLIFLAKRAESFIYWRAKHILVNSPAYVDYLVKRGIAREKISLIPNGVDPGMFNGHSSPEKIREEFGLDDKFVVSYTGAIGPANDIATIVRAADLLKDRQDVHFLIVGGGKALAEVQQMVSDKSLSNISIAGVRQKSEIPNILAGSDACVATLLNIPMFAMTYPNKIFDYMAASKPIVLGIDGVIRKVMEDGKGGIFVEPGNEHELADAVAWMAENREAAKQMGVDGRNYVTQQFNREAHAREFCELLESLTIGKKIKR